MSDNRDDSTTLTARECRWLTRLIEDEDRTAFWWRILCGRIVPFLALILVIGWVWQGVLECQQYVEVARELGERPLAGVEDQGLTAKQWRMVEHQREAFAHFVFAGMLAAILVFGLVLRRYHRVLHKLGRDRLRTAMSRNVPHSAAASKEGSGKQ